MEPEEGDRAATGPHPPAAPGAVEVVVSDISREDNAAASGSNGGLVVSEEEGDQGNGLVNVKINGKRHTFERVNDTDTFLKLYRTLNESQKRVIRMRQPHDTNLKAVERAGVGAGAIHRWLWNNPDNDGFSEAFRRLWYSIRYPDDVVETMTYVANLLGERNLWRLEDIASLSERWDSLKKEDKVEARKAVERLATLPFERHDKAKEEVVSGFAEAWFKLLAEKRAMVVEASVVDVEVTQ